jgi:hypothetical protein
MTSRVVRIENTRKLPKLTLKVIQIRSSGHDLYGEYPNALGADGLAARAQFIVKKLA